MKKKSSRHNYSFIIFILFVALAFLSSFFPFFPIDLKISRAIQNIHNYPFDLLMKTVSSVGGGRAMPLMVASIVSLIALLNLKLEAIYLSISSLASLLAGSLTKFLVNRPRPDDQLVTIYKYLQDNSFPSSHTITYTVIFGFMIYVCLTRLKPSWEKNVILFLSILMISTIGLSRIYLGAHWASDVIGGYLLGAYWLIITVNIYKAHVQR